MPITTASIREPMPVGALRGAIQANGTVLWYMPGDTLPPDPVPTLADVKAARIEADRQECRRRLVEHYGDALEQTSRRDGDYGAAAQANIRAGVPATIDASNVARDAINAATTAAAVEAVTVAWPVLT